MLVFDYNTASNSIEAAWKGDNMKTKKIITLLMVMVLSIGTVMQVSAASTKSTSVTVDGSKYTCYNTYSSGSYHTVAFRIGGSVKASLSASAAWLNNKNVYVAGNSKSVKAESLSTVSDGKAVNDNYKSCTIFYVITKGGTTKQKSIKAFD